MRPAVVSTPLGGEAWEEVGKIGHDLALTLPLHRPEPDIAAAESVGPADAIDRLVRPRLRLRDRLAERGDVEHAIAVRENAPAIGFGAGVKDFDAFDLGSGIEPFDDRSPGRGTGIPLC